MSRQIFRGHPFPSLGLHMSAPMAVPMRLAPSGVRQASIIPPIARPSFWKSLVPKALKARWADKTTKKPRSREWNPATFFIAIFILIGSMSIQMIALQKNFAEFMRQSDVRIGLLREVVERIQRGEEVDVEKALGTGDPEREVEWQEVLEELGKEDLARDRKRKQTEAATIETSKEQRQPSREGHLSNDVAPASPTSRPSFF